MTTTGSQQVVFIDSRVSDVQDLLNGVQPGDLVFVLDPNSDGVQQIADILAANHLSDLSAISIVGHGAAGSVDLGSSVLTDANLSSFADALAKIGAALAASGDLQLYACDVASGATGATFIADLATLTSADIAAATHLVGSADLGGSWTLDASTGPIEAGTPFTQAALSSFQGDLVANPVTGQLWIGAGGDGIGNPDTHSDFRVYHSDSDGLADDRIIAKENAPTGLWQAVGLDTSANLFFAMDNSYHFTVNNLTTGAQLSSTVVASTTDQDVFNNFVVDATNNIIYADLFGYDYLDTNPAPYSGLHGGDLIKFTYNQTTGAITPAYTFNDAGPTHSINMNDVLIDSGTTSGATRYADGRSFWLSPDGSTLYYVDDNDNDPGGFWGFSTNAILKVSTTGSVGTGDAPTPVLLSLQSQFPVDDSNGYITALTVDSADGIIYFTTDSVNPTTNTSQNAIWWMPIAGGTATKMTLPGGVTLTYPSFFGQNITFDPNARVLYVADAGNDPGSVNSHIIKLTLSGDGHSFTSGVNDFNQFDTNGVADGSIANSLVFDALPNLSVSGTAAHAAEQGANINLDTSVTLSDDQGRLASFSVQITGGTFSSNETSNNDDHLSVNGQTSGALGGALSGITVSWNSATETLTLSGDDTVAHYQTAVSEVQYNTTGDNPTNYGANTTRTITWIASDGVTITHPDATDPNQQSTTITIDAVNDPPVVGGANNTVGYTEQAAAIALDASLTVTDPDNTTLTGATVKISAGFLPGDTLHFTNQNGITGAYDAATGILTLSGSSSVANYQTALRSVTFDNASNDNPTDKGLYPTRTIDWQVNDGTALAGDLLTPPAHFTTGTDPTSVAIGDFNGDGKLDLATANDGSDDVSILLGDGSGGFGAATSFAAGTNPFGVATGDFNGDGKLDLAVANDGSNNVSILLGDGLGGFGAAVNFAAGTNPREVAVGDLNGDGKLDLAVANEGGTDVSVLLGDGSGGFGTATNFTVGSNPQSVAIGDFNGDGKLDLAVANHNSDNVSILLGDGSGGFGAATNFAVGSEPYSVAIGDFNNDGKLDLAVANSQDNNVSVLLGDGSGGFGAATNFATDVHPLSVAAADLNGDGKLDLAVSNFNSNDVSVLLGNGSGGFAAATNFPAGTQARAVAIGNVDGAGGPELVIANQSPNTVSVLFNKSTSLSAVQHTTVNVTAVNDAAVLDLNGATAGTGVTLSYTENDPATAISPAATVTDVDSVNFNGGNLTITIASVTASDQLTIGNQGTGAGQIGISGSDVTYGGVTIGTFAGGNGSGLTVTFNSAAATPAAAQALVDDIFYSNTSDNPPGSRTVSYSLDDGGGNHTGLDSGNATAIINITAVNDPPVVGGAGNTVGYTEQAAAIALDSSLTVNDVDNANLTGATVKISAGLLPGDTLHFTNQNGITGSYDAATGILTLSGSSSVANYQTALRSVTFDNATNDNPTDLGLYPTRTIEWQVNDGTALSGALYGTATNFVTDHQPYSVAIGDFNGDGKLDLAVANFGSGDVSVLLGNGDGTFAAANNFAAGSGPTSVAIADLNGDGKLDLAVANSGSDNVSVLLGDGLGGFATATSFSVDTAPYAVAIADLNGDGKLDLVTANSGSDDISVLLGDGAGGFGTATNFAVGTGPESIAIGDFNGDGKLDIAVANVGSDNVSVLLGNGDGSFGAATNFTVGTGPVSVAIGDFNGDGKLDLVTANDGSDNVSVLLGNGSGGFGAATDFAVGSVPYSVAVADLNGDGKADLAVGNNGSNNVSVLIGDGLGGFAAATNFAVGTNPVPVAIGNLDGSGGLDLVAANEGSDDLSVLLNASTALSATQRTTVDVTAVNDPPVLFSGFNNVVGFTEGGAATTLSSSGVIEDPDSMTLASATAQITTGLLAGDTLSVDLPMTGNLVDGTNITVTYTAGTGLLSLSGTDTLANYQNVIEHVQYSTASIDPTNGGADTSRIVTWQLDDGAGSNNLSATATTEVDVTAVNSPPVVGGAGNSVLYPALSSGTTLDADLTVSDVDNANLTGATVRISSGLQFGDRLNFANQNGITGSYDAVNGILTLTGTASVADYQTALRSITFDSTSANPTDSGLYVHRTIDWQVNDGTGPVSPLFQNQVTYPVGTTVESVVAADFNKDGKLDLAFADYYAAVAQVALGNGDGTFVSAVPYSVGNGAVGIATGDINNDSNPDLVVSNAIDNTVSILLGNGDGTFQPQQTIATDTAPFYVALADFNGDGKLDLVVGANDTIALALGNGNGTFGSLTVVATGADAAIGDFNNDGKLDLAVHDSSTHAISVLLGDGSGAFAAPVSVATGDGVVAGDFNGDGKLDLAVLDYAGGNILTYLGNGTGAFTLHGTYATDANPGAISVGDLNGDGVLDIAVANYNPTDEFNVLIGDGSGGFAAPQTYASGISGVGVAIGDFDGVNGADVAAAYRDSANALSVYLNNANNLSGVQHTTVTIDAAPVVANAGNTVSYTEQQTTPAAILVDSAITVTDSDSTTLTSATVKITSGVVAGDLLAAVTTGTAITAVWNGTDTLTLSGADTKANYQQVLQSVTFTSSSDDPTSGGADPSRTITWTATDDLGAPSAPVTTTINVTAVNDAPTATITPPSYSATEGVSLNLKNNGLAVSDPDGNAGSSSETVTLSVSPEGVLNVTAGTSGALVTNSGTATVTITGTAAQINALLNTDSSSTVAYIDNSDTPVASATLSLTIHDNGSTGGGDLSSSTSTTINITSVNDPPVFTNLGGVHPSFTEGGSSVVLDNDVTVSDPELHVSPNNYAGATLTLARDGGANPDDSFAGTGSLDLVDTNGLGENVSLDGGATFIGTYTNPGDGSVSFTFNANATEADIASVMHQIVYADASDNPPSSVQIDWTFSDGNGQPGGQTQGDTGPTPGIATGSVTVDITPVDQPPALLNVAVAASYVPGSSGVILSSGLQAYDPDAAPPSPNPGLVSATITIATGFLAGDELFVNLPTSGGFFVVDDGAGPVTTNISVTSNTAGQLVLGGLDSVLHYQDVLDAVSYHSTAADPTNGGTDFTRTITWKVSDGALDNSAPSVPHYPETTLGINQPPTVDLDSSAGGTGYVTSFTENGAPLAIVNANVSVSDPDDATISTATIVLTNAKPGDALSIVGTLPSGISGSIDTSVAGQITVQLSGVGSFADYQTALQQIRFVNTSDNPDATDRDITVQVANEEESNVAHATVHVIPVNDPPVLANVASSVSTAFTGQTLTLSPSLTVSDVDNVTLAGATVAITAGTFAGDGDVLAAATTGTSISASYSAATEILTLSGTDTLAHYQSVLESVTFHSTNSNPTNSGVDPTRTVTWTVDDGSASNNLSAPATTTIQLRLPPRSDFNGDGKSDLLFQNQAIGNGSVIIDLMNGTTVTSSASIADPSGAKVEADGDFNHDGKADLVLQDPDGTPEIWLMNGTSVTGKVTLPNPGTFWHVIATGDFNADGSADILWQGNDGTPGIWLMNGTSVGWGDPLPNPGTFWHAVGTGDFNGDGKADILWQGADGTPAIWMMNGSSIAAWGDPLPNPGTFWRVVGTGDFNGDGKADILWQGADGTPAIWLMNGSSIAAWGNPLPNPGTSWHVIGTGDYNGDGKADILWQSNDGTPGVWFMDGSTIAAWGGAIPNPGPTWQLKDDGPIVFDATADNAATDSTLGSPPSTGGIPGTKPSTSLSGTDTFVAVPATSTNLPGTGAFTVHPDGSVTVVQAASTNLGGIGPFTTHPDGSVTVVQAASTNLAGVTVSPAGSGPSQTAALFHSAPDAVGSDIMHLSAPDTLVDNSLLNGSGSNFALKPLGQS